MYDGDYRKPEVILSHPYDDPDYNGASEADLLWLVGWLKYHNVNGISVVHSHKSGNIDLTWSSNELMESGLPRLRFALEGREIRAKCKPPCCDPEKEMEMEGLTDRLEDYYHHQVAA